MKLKKEGKKSKKKKRSKKKYKVSEQKEKINKMQAELISKEGSFAKGEREAVRDFPSNIIKKVRKNKP